MFILTLITLLLVVGCLILLVVVLRYFRHLRSEIPTERQAITDKLTDAAEKLSEVSEKLSDVSKSVEALRQKIGEIMKPVESDSKEPPVTKAAYNDAVVAFTNVNDKFYGLRKYKQLCHELMQMLCTGKYEDVDLSKVADKDKEKAVALKSYVRIFNENYRPQLIGYLEALGHTWDECVRFPLGKPYDPEWDEEMLGNDVDEGTIVRQVVQLGYEFPDSVVLGRTKSKIFEL